MNPKVIRHVFGGYCCASLKIAEINARSLLICWHGFYFFPLEDSEKPLISSPATALNQQPNTFNLAMSWSCIKAPTATAAGSAYP